MFPAALATASRRCLDEVPPFDAATVRRMVTEDPGRSPTQIFPLLFRRPPPLCRVDRPGPCLRPTRRDGGGCQAPAPTHQGADDDRPAHHVPGLAATFQRTSWGRSAQRGRPPSATSTPSRSKSSNPAVEAWRQQRFRGWYISAFGDNKWIIAPEVYWDFCGPRMICMERVCGVPMDDFDAIRGRGVDGELVLRRGRQGVGRGRDGPRTVPRRHARRQHLGARRRPGLLSRLRDHGRAHHRVAPAGQGPVLHVLVRPRLRPGCPGLPAGGCLPIRTSAPTRRSASAWRSS